MPLAERACKRAQLWPEMRSAPEAARVSRSDRGPVGEAGASLLLLAGAGLRALLLRGGGGGLAAARLALIAAHDAFISAKHPVDTGRAGHLRRICIFFKSSTPRACCRTVRRAEVSRMGHRRSGRGLPWGTARARAQAPKFVCLRKKITVITAPTRVTKPRSRVVFVMRRLRRAPR